MLDEFVRIAYTIIQLVGWMAAHTKETTTMATMTRTLTRTEGYALTDAHTAVRPSVNLLVTRTMIYRWDMQAEVWVGAKSEHLVQHVAKRSWDTKTKTFVVCDCCR